MRNAGRINRLHAEARTHGVKAVQIFAKTGRVGAFFMRALMAALVLLSARDGEAA